MITRLLNGDIIIRLLQGNMITRLLQGEIIIISQLQGDIL